MLLTRMSSHGRIFFVEMILSAALAQLVERRLGKAEVGGSNPLGSSSKRFRRSNGLTTVTADGFFVRIFSRICLLWLQLQRLRC